MQASVPELTDIAKEPDIDLRAVRRRRSESPARSPTPCCMARRMVERGVRFVQIYHNNWDTHANVAGRLPDQCRDVDQPCYGLIQDLKRRGLFDSTLVIWGGEFGRTIYSQGGLSQEELRPRSSSALLHDVDGRRRLAWRPDLRRDGRLLVQHRQGSASTSATSTPPSCICSGFDHERFTYRYQGLDQSSRAWSRPRSSRNCWRERLSRSLP